MPQCLISPPPGPGTQPGPAALEMNPGAAIKERKEAMAAVVASAVVSPISKTAAAAFRKEGLQETLEEDLQMSDSSSSSSESDTSSTSSSSSSSSQLAQASIN